MRFLLLILGAVGLFAFGLCGMSKAPGRPVPGEMPVVPGEIRFQHSVRAELRGLSRREGKGGAAIALAKSRVLAIADDRFCVARRERNSWTSIQPAFAQNAGACLPTNSRRDCRREFASVGRSRCLPGAVPSTPHRAAGIQRRGVGSLTNVLFLLSWRRGQRRAKAGSIVEGSFLVGQRSRTAHDCNHGRPELGAPDWPEAISRKADVSAGNFL